jgi:DNA repair exonuclease SbcCD nuclease subunit
MPFSFLHAADLHLDTPFANVGGFPDAVGEALREASLEAWANLVEEASRRRVAFVLLAGDLYDGAQRGIRAQRAFLQGVTRLAEEGIRTFVVAGNHDPVVEGWSAIRDLPELVTSFPAHQVESVEFEAGGEQVMVHGISYATAATTENLALRFPAADRPGFHVGLLHANVGGATTGHQDYSPCSVEDLRAPGYQYWALGHVHGRRVLSEEPWIVYPGNLQGRSTKPTEQGAKGAVVVSVHHGVASAPEPVALDRIRFQDLAVSIDRYRDVAALMDQLERLADPAAHQGRSLVVRATIEGSGHLHAELAPAARQAEVLEELRRRGTEGTPFVWWHSLTWRTRPVDSVVDLRRRGDDFAADLERSIAEAGPELVGSWRDLLPNDLARELGALLPAEDDQAIWQAAQQAARNAITAVDA